MKPQTEVQKKIEKIFNTIEPLIMAEIQNSGLNLAFALHLVNVKGNGGGVISNIPLEQARSFADYCHDAMFASLKRHAESQ